MQTKKQYPKSLDMEKFLGDYDADTVAKIRVLNYLTEYEHHEIRAHGAGLNFSPKSIDGIIAYAGVDTPQRANGAVVTLTALGMISTDPETLAFVITDKGRQVRSALLKIEDMVKAARSENSHASRFSELARSVARHPSSGRFF